MDARANDDVPCSVELVVELIGGETCASSRTRSSSFATAPSSAAFRSLAPVGEKLVALQKR